MSSTFFVDNSRTGGGAEEASQMLFPGLSREQLAERLVAAEAKLAETLQLLQEARARVAELETAAVATKSDSSSIHEGAVSPHMSKSSSSYLGIQTSAAGAGDDEANSPDSRDVGYALSGPSPLRPGRSMRWSDQMRITRKISIKVCEAKDLPKGSHLMPLFMAKNFETESQYVRLTMDHHEIGRTKPVSKQMMWNEDFEREIDGNPDSILVTVFVKGKIKSAVFKDTAVAQLNLKMDQLNRDSQRHEEWMPLYRPRHNKDSLFGGTIFADIVLSSRDATPNTMVTVTVRVIEGLNLADREEGGGCYPSVVLHLLPDDELKSTRQTQPKYTDSENPIFNEIFTFSVPKSALAESSLHVSVWNNNPNAKKEAYNESDFLGQVLLPLCEFEVLVDLNEVPEGPGRWYTLSDRQDRESKSMLAGAVMGAANAVKTIARTSSAKIDRDKINRSQSNLQSLLRSASSTDIGSLVKHEIAMVTFTSPIDCDQCGGAIIRPGYKCKVCNMAIHEACKSGVLMPCATAGQIRLSYRYSEESMLPYGTYTRLLELLTEDKMQLLTCLGKACDVDRLTELAKCSVNIFQSQGSAVNYLNMLVSAEVNATKEANILFRGNTIATKAVDYYMKLIGRDYLAATLKRTINEIFAEKKPCELDPTRVPHSGDKSRQAAEIQNNRKNLTSVLRKVLDAINATLDQCPMPLRKIFNHMQTEVENKFPDVADIRYIVVSGFIFLRFFCPAILGPKLFGLRSDLPDFNTARTLTLSAKVLQNLANLVDFAQKEPYMIDMNEFIQERKAHMMVFIDALAGNAHMVPLHIADLEEKIKVEQRIAEAAQSISTKEVYRNSKSLVKKEVGVSQVRIAELTKELDIVKKSSESWGSNKDEALEIAKKFNVDVEVELAHLHGQLSSKRYDVISALDAKGEDGMSRALSLALDELDTLRLRLQKPKTLGRSSMMMLEQGGLSRGPSIHDLNRSAVDLTQISEMV